MYLSTMNSTRAWQELWETSKVNGVGGKTFSSNVIKNAGENKKKTMTKMSKV